MAQQGWSTDIERSFFMEIKPGLVEAIPAVKQGPWNLQKVKITCRNLIV